MKTRAGGELPQPPPKKQAVAKKRKTREERFLVGGTLEKLPTAQLPLRKHIIQRFLFLRDLHPKKKTSQLAACAMTRGGTFR